MKNRITLAIITLFFAFNWVQGSVHLIGNHTIHYENGMYYKIYQADTFYIDTTTVILKYESFADIGDISTLESSFGLVRKHEFITNYISYNYGTSLDFITYCTSLSNQTEVEVFDFNTGIKLLCDPLIPNDDDYLSDQWYLQRLEVPHAWSITTGNENVKVAIIDTGFDWEHNDLGPGNDGYESTHFNLAEDDWQTWNDPCSGNTVNNDLDPISNPYIDDYKGKGWNGEDPSCPGNGQSFMYNDTRPYSIQWLISHGFQEPQTKHIHGTYIAGIIGAKTNNGYGIAGITGGWNEKGVSLIYYKFTGLYNGTFSGSDDAARGIEYAIDQNANIIQMAFATGDSPNLIAMLEEAYNNDIFLVAGAGNGYGNDISFPASHANVFAVGATGYDDLVMPISNQGSELDLCAPGEDIHGIKPNNLFIDLNGHTSAASAMTSGTVALMLSANPDLTNAEINDILHASADEVHPNEYDYDINGWCEEIGHGRLNTYRAVCMAWEYIEIDEEIQTNTTWTDPKTFMNDVFVNNGVKLTITSEIQFGPDARLIVEPGATVEVNSGTLTNLKCCGYDNNLWKGVEVWGNTTKSQNINPFDNIQWQGKLVMKNGGTIENAEVGVFLSARDDSPNGYDENKCGGIVTISNGGNPLLPDAYFINNQRAAMFKPYTNFNPLNPLSLWGNLSQFMNCHFEVNTNYINGAWYYDHVHTSTVGGIRFGGCTFVNNKTTSPAGHGINGWASGFTVEAICNSVVSPCPEIDLDKCYFINFKKGINNLSSGSRTVTVTDAIFTDNSYGVKLRNVNNATILFNDFELGDPTPCGLSQNAAFGIDMDQCTGFAIEENYFTKSSQALPGYYIGIRDKDSRTEYDIIYKNSFEGLSYGNFAEGNNRLTSDDRHGLEYQCNTNTSNNIDFIVTTNNPQNPAQIRTFQGMQDKEAGNTFSSGVQLPDGHFKNTGTQTIDYFYNTNPLVYYTPYYVVPIYVSYENTCPSNYGGGGSGGSSGKGLVLTPEQKQQSELDFATSLDDYNNVKALYDNLKDGGNTEALQTDVEMSWPQDMWELRAELLGNSPHLSKEVLIAAADKTEVLPESILFEILSANPDELRKEELINYLENKEEPLPQYMISILKQLAGGITYKTILLQDMAMYNASSTVAAYDLIRSNLNEPESDYAYLRNWLDNLNNINADLQIVSTYLHEGDYTSAQTLLDLIPGLYTLEGAALINYNDFKSVTEMQMLWEQQGRDIFELNDTEIASLVDYAENSIGKASIVAQGILEFAYGYEYCNCPPVGDSSVWKSSGINPLTQTTESNWFIEATPNPANIWVAFDYKLPQYSSEAVLQITDLSGKAITAFKLNSKQGQYVWDIRDIGKGVYIYTLKAGSVTKSGKLVIE